MRVKRLKMKNMEVRGSLESMHSKNAHKFLTALKWDIRRRLSEFAEIEVLPHFTPRETTTGIIYYLTKLELVRLENKECLFCLSSKRRGRQGVHFYFNELYVFGIEPPEEDLPHEQKKRIHEMVLRKLGPHVNAPIIR